MFGFARRFTTTAERIVDAPGLESFLARRSAFVSQKCTVEYCRARAGLFWDKLMLETAFLEAMEVCRWEALAAVYADLAVMAEGFLRSALRDEAEKVAVADFLAEAMQGALAVFPVPAHRAEGGWTDAVVALRQRLAEAQMATPRHPKDIGYVSGPKLHAVMPIHSNMMAFDRQLVVNSVRFQLVRVYEDFQAQADRAAVAGDILRRAAAGVQA